MKNKKDDVREWLRRAESNFEIAKRGKTSPKIVYEDLCYDCQQAAEKAIKAVLIFYNLPFPKTHNIKHLLKLLNEGEIEVPKVIEQAQVLTEYIVDTRYPDDFAPVDSKAYKQALKLAAKVLQWAKILIEKKPDKLF